MILECSLKIVNKDIRVAQPFTLTGGDRGTRGPTPHKYNTNIIKGDPAIGISPPAGDVVGHREAVFIPKV